MKKLDEDSALAIVFANIRRKKRSNDLVTIAKSFEYLVNLYGSPKDVADKVGLSMEMIRQFLAVLKLPKEIQKIFSKRQIDSVDAAKELVALRDPTQQVLVAEELIKSLSKDTRDIKRLVKGANVTIVEAKKTVFDAKPEGLHIFVMDFDHETYQTIRRDAKTLRIKPAELVKRIVLDWLKQKVDKEKQ